MGEWIDKYHTIYEDYCLEILGQDFVLGETNLVILELVCNFWEIPYNQFKQRAEEGYSTSIIDLVRRFNPIEKLKQYNEDELLTLVSEISQQINIGNTMGDWYKAWAEFILRGFFTLESLLSVTSELETESDMRIALVTLLLTLHQSSLVNLNLTNKQLATYIKGVSVKEREELLTKLRSTVAFTDYMCFDINEYALLIEDTKYDVLHST